jgi:hypothetical protein
MVPRPSRWSTLIGSRLAGRMTPAYFCLGESCVADLAACVPVLGILKDHLARAGPTGPAALDELSEPLQVALLSRYFTTATSYDRSRHAKCIMMITARRQAAAAKTHQEGQMKGPRQHALPRE